MGSMRKRKYNGCELSSPLYRQIAAEMVKKKSKVRCIALKRNAERCKNMTDNKNGKCYAHQ